MKFYPWQTEIIEIEGDCTIRGGRQSGKSWAVAKQIVKRAEKYPGSRHLILAASERQENYLLDKVKDLIGDNKSNYIGRPTLTHLYLKGSKTHIYKFPVGVSGIYIEGLSSIDFIYIDEAIHVGHKVFDSIIPMMVEPKKRGLGWMTLLSSTRGKPKGFFYDSFKMKHFKKFQIKTSDCEHADLKFLEQERERLGEIMYKVIYEGEFDENAHKYFAKEIVMKNVKIPFWSLKNYREDLGYYCGIDPARYGRSKAAWAVAELINKEKIRIIYGQEEKKTSLLDLRDITRNLDSKFKKFRKLFIDDGGFGAGLIDLMEKEFKRRLRPMNNKTATGKGKILKEDLYSNLLRLLETEQIDLIDDPIIIEGLLGVELDADSRIIGTDMSEAVSRAAWCVKESRSFARIRSF